MDLTLKGPSRICSRWHSNFFFFFFHRKQVLTFHVNHLPSRHFTWNFKTCFLWKIKKKKIEAWQNLQNDVRPVKTQISLIICPVWSESLLCAQSVAKTQAFMWRVGCCPGWSESSLGVHYHFVSFVMRFVMRWRLIIGLDKRGYQINIFLISPQKHMLWVLIRSTHNICFH